MEIFVRSKQKGHKHLFHSQTFVHLLIPFILSLGVCCSAVTSICDLFIYLYAWIYISQQTILPSSRQKPGKHEVVLKI